MGSIRARLTAAYAAAFIGMLVIFSIALLAVRRELLFRELEARVQSEADQVVRAINLARNTGTDPIVAQNDPLAGPSVSFRMQSFLSLLDGYVLVQDSSTYDIYASPAVQRLSTSDRDVLSTAAREATPSRTIRRVAMRADTADMLRATSSDSEITRLDFTPAAGSNSYSVTTGPGRTAVMRPLTPKSDSTASSMRAFSSSASSVRCAVSFTATDTSASSSASSCSTHTAITNATDTASPIVSRQPESPDCIRDALRGAVIACGRAVGRIGRLAHRYSLPNGPDRA